MSYWDKGTNLKYSQIILKQATNEGSCNSKGCDQNDISPFCSFVIGER